MYHSRETEATERTETMFSAPYYYKLEAGRPRFTVFKHLSQGTLAVLMFVALAVLASIGGKQPATNPIPSSNATGNIASPLQGPCLNATEHRGPKKDLRLASRPPIATWVSALKEAFNDPALVNYANQQWTGIPESTAQFGVGSAGQFAHSRSLSNLPTTQK